MHNVPFVIGLMFVLVLMNNKLRQGACVSCGKRIWHADDCPTQKGRS